MKPIFSILMLAWRIAAAALTPARSQTPVSLELVPAVDVWFSVNDRGFSLQMHGIAAAFRSKVVIEATDHTDFAHAMRLKLLRELEPAVSWRERGIPLTEQAVAGHAKWFVMECPL